MRPLFMSLTSLMSISFAYMSSLGVAANAMPYRTGQPLCLVLCVFCNKFRFFCWCTAVNVVSLLPPVAGLFNTKFYCHSPASAHRPTALYWLPVLFGANNAAICAQHSTFTWASEWSWTLEHVYLRLSYLIFLAPCSVIRWILSISAVQEVA